MEKIFNFLEKSLMGPMSKLSQFKIVRAIMAAGMATIPFTIVGSMFLVINALPETFDGLQGIYDATFFRFSDLYMLANACTMGILSIYFCLAVGYELTRIASEEDGLNVNPLNGAFLSLFAFFMTIPELVLDKGYLTLVQVNTETEKVVDGFRVAGGITRLGTVGIFTAILMAVLATQIYFLCVRKNWVIKMPDTVPPGVSRSFTALIPAFCVAISVIIIEGILVSLGTDISKVIEIPFGFVTKLTQTYIGLLVIVFFIHALWIVGIHGSNIIGGLISPMVLANVASNAAGADIPFAGEFNSLFVLVGGCGATLVMTFYIAFFAKADQLKVLGKASMVPAIFNINEPIIFGMPIVYNPYLAIPFFLAPMVTASIGYWTIKLHIIKPIIALTPWPSPAGLGAFIGTGGDVMAGLVAIACIFIAFIIWFPFVKMYDNKLVAEEQGVK